MMKRLKYYFHRLVSPEYFYGLAGRLTPWFIGLFLVLLGIGIWGAFTAPPDYQQGESYRIIFVHVPSAYLSMLIYVTMAVAGLIGLVWHIKIAEIAAVACAPVGALFTALALATGSLWGKPMWGTYWVWDARLTSELILLFLYIGVIGLYNAIDDHRKAARAVAILALVGVVNIPIIHFSVEWWNTLHQPATLSKLEKPSMHPDMLWPLLVMITACTVYFPAVLFMRMRALLLRQERRSRWVAELLGESQP